MIFAYWSLSKLKGKKKTCKGLFVHSTTFCISLQDRCRPLSVVNNLSNFNENNITANHCSSLCTAAPRPPPPPQKEIGERGGTTQTSLSPILLEGRGQLYTINVVVSRSEIILGDLRVVNWVERKGATKVFKHALLGTLFYQTGSRRSRPFWLLTGARKRLCFSAQSESNKPWELFRPCL